MKITRKSQLTGIENTLDIEISSEELFRVENRFDSNFSKELIQNIVPKLSQGLREFLKTGITPDEWQREFGSIED